MIMIRKEEKGLNEEKGFKIYIVDDNYYISSYTFDLFFHIF